MLCSASNSTIPKIIRARPHFFLECMRTNYYLTDCHRTGLLALQYTPPTSRFFAEVIVPPATPSSAGLDLCCEALSKEVDRTTNTCHGFGRNSADLSDFVPVCCWPAPVHNEVGVVRTGNRKIDFRSGPGRVLHGVADPESVGLSQARDGRVFATDLGRFLKPAEWKRSLMPGAKLGHDRNRSSKLKNSRTASSDSAIIGQKSFRFTMSSPNNLLELLPSCPLTITPRSSSPNRGIRVSYKSLRDQVDGPWPDARLRRWASARAGPRGHRAFPNGLPAIVSFSRGIDRGHSRSAQSRLSPGRVSAFSSKTLVRGGSALPRLTEPRPRGWPLKDVFPVHSLITDESRRCANSQTRPNGPHRSASSLG